MKTVKASALISCFQQMYKEHWSYSMGAAEKGCVDCSGAFVYAFHVLGGPSLPHGSNSIYRKNIGWVVSTPVPGYAAFKIRKDGEEPERYREDGIGNVYHVGLVDADAEHILNAKGTLWGFCRDSCRGWTCYAPLRFVDYGTEEGKSMAELYKATVNTKQGTLFLRRTPEKGGQKITGIPKGETVSVTSEENGWCGVTYGSLSGYVSAAYLLKEGEAETAAWTRLADTNGQKIRIEGEWHVSED